MTVRSSTTPCSACRSRLQRRQPGGLDDAAAQLDRKGIPHGGVKDIGAGFILELRDPDDIALELFAAES